MGASLGRAVLFVDDPATPLTPWETATQGGSAVAKHELRFWRICMIVRLAGRHTRYGDGKSRAVWHSHGGMLRRMVRMAAPDSSLAYLYGYSARYDVEAYLPSWDERDTRVSPRVLGSSGDACRRIRTEVFPDEVWWPGQSWTSGTAVFLPSGDSRYRQELERAFDVGDFAEIRRLMFDVRFNMSLLSDLMESACVYATAYALAPPESSDPWLFFPRAVSSEGVVSMLSRELCACGFEVLVSNRIQEFHDWQEHDVLPSDAAPHCEP